MTPIIRNSIAVVVLAVLTVLSCMVGVASMTDLSNGISIDWQIFFYSRLPRSLSILLTGVSLSIAGLMLQVLFTNRFVEPSMVGTTQGAALGLLFMIVYFPSANLLLKMFVATISGLMTTLFFLRLVKRIPPSNTLMVPLIGMIYAGILSSIGIFFAYELDLLQMLDVWLNGEFSGVLLGRYELLWVSLAMTIVAYICADRLTIAGLGEAMARNLGLNYQHVMYLGLLIVTVIVATVVVTIGSIPFLGLIVPNIVSRLFGDNLRKSLPWVAYIGATLLLVCDIIARTVNYPYEISVSMIMGIVGTVIFLILLFKKGKAYA